MAGFGTLLFTWLKGKLVGTDTAGNRWVIYSRVTEASAVPPEWHAWLHHTVDAPLTDSERRAWQKPHVASATGTSEAWLP